jgi:hypothetical protein
MMQGLACIITVQPQEVDDSPYDEIKRGNVLRRVDCDFGPKSFSATHMMKTGSGEIRLSAGDLGNRLACHYLTSLDLAVSVWAKPPPAWHLSDARALHEHRMMHERCLLRAFGRLGSVILNLRDIDNSERPLAETRAAMESGANLITEVCDAA